MNITEKQFNQFSDIVYQECGINLHDGKQQLLQARVSKRLRATGIKSINEYLARVNEDAGEMVDFIDAVSTNHTYFFREKQHFTYLDETHQEIWCAASSSGEEPYSIAIHCLEKGFRPSIFATDISTNVLKKGRAGIFPTERAKSLAAPMLKNYFQKGTGKWEAHIRVKDDIRKMVTFQRFNLVTDPVSAKEYDIIFCRNVLIYFDNPTKARVVNKLHNALKGGGYLIIGGAESLNNIEHRYAYVSPSVYQKK